ncbi:MAG: putative dioxygenase [Candidatus Xenolissoclinum pacificiensis L6]|uniref:Dioxygenase n=1 Tax=Candidatus Xenolissoclinum pacificiensis L6 TaxID=1401685 RepID=W2V093_9RICK|nr:MAG: putative dioxygenase [Candidatus Xenolissoclinum pacificiensis L6]
MTQDKARKIVICFTSNNIIQYNTIAYLFLIKKVVTLSIVKKLNISGKLVWPIIEGGKGVSVSDGVTAGHFAKYGAVGTLSAVFPTTVDSDGHKIPVNPVGNTRRDRNVDLVKKSIKNAIAQVRKAYDISRGSGCIHINILWEETSTYKTLEAILEEVSPKINGVTSGAGLPYALGELASRFGVYYYPIVSSVRAFKILWQRSYKRYVKFLGGVVYEDPWLAGGHNGLSNKEDPNKPIDPYYRVKDIRTFMNEVGLEKTPIIIAGGVWALNEWKHYIDNPEIGVVAFQFGTRPLLTQESPISNEWKKRLMELKEGDIVLHRYSPTGFYSSAVRNSFLRELEDRSSRQLDYSGTQDEIFSEPFEYSKRRNRILFLKKDDISKATYWFKEGFDVVLKTPSDTIIFVDREKSLCIRQDQIDCIGCLSACKFSNWCDKEETGYTTGKRPDPRSFCISKTLFRIISGRGSIDEELMFSGHQAYRFGQDDLYKDKIPTIQELISTILKGV